MLRSRLKAQVRSKVALLLGLTLGICVPYFGLQAFATSPTRTLPVTWLDRAIFFQPVWAYAYASIALLVPLFPLLASDARQLARYAKGLALLCAVNFAAFALYPVDGPRPQGVAEHALYRFLVDVDAPTNSFPSLHAGLTVYSFLFGYAILGGALGRRGRIAFVLAACIWGGAILYSTLAIKQHWVVDLPVGVVAAWLAHRWAWGRAETTPHWSPSCGRERRPPRRQGGAAP